MFWVTRPVKPLANGVLSLSIETAAMDIDHDHTLTITYNKV